MKSYWLIPWSVGFECRTVKPTGHSIEVVDREDVDKLIKLAQAYLATRRTFEDSSSPERFAFAQAVGEYERQHGDQSS